MEGLYTPCVWEPLHVFTTWASLTYKVIPGHTEEVVEDDGEDEAYTGATVDGRDVSLLEEDRDPTVNIKLFPSSYHS